MNTNSPNKKFKRPKQKTQLTTNPESSRSSTRRVEENKCSETTCPLAAKDSEWVDILQTPSAGPEETPNNVFDEEEVLQLVECEDGPQMKPLAIMFPGLLEKDPNTLEGMLNKVMSTTEVTKHLVDLGQKANFTFMKKADRLIPKDKQWLEKLTENSNSLTSFASALFNGSSVSSGYDADNEVTMTSGDENRVAKTETVEVAGTDSQSGRINAHVVASLEQIMADISQANKTVSQSKVSSDNVNIDETQRERGI